MRIVLTLALSTALLAVVIPIENEDISISSEVTERIDNRDRSRESNAGPTYFSESGMRDDELAGIQPPAQRSWTSGVRNFSARFAVPQSTNESDAVSTTSMDPQVGGPQHVGIIDATRNVISTAIRKLGSRYSTDESDAASTASMEPQVGGRQHVGRIDAARNAFSTGIRNLALGVGGIRPASKETPGTSETVGVWRDTEDTIGNGPPTPPPSSLGRLGNTARYHFSDSSEDPFPPNVPDFA